MDLERCFSKKNWAKAYKVCIYMGESLPESRGPKNSQKVATYQGFMRILSVFTVIFAYLMSF